MYNAKNYTEQGGERTVIDGELVINGKLKVGNSEFKQAANVPESTASTVVAAVSDLNDLISALKTAGLMEADS